MEQIILWLNDKTAVQTDALIWMFRTCSFNPQFKLRIYLFSFRFSVPCIVYRLQINILTDATNLYLYFLCFLSPYMFRAFTGPSSGVS
jgi:hypothetical protein